MSAEAVKMLNWKGNCRALWQALDHDASGITTIEELLGLQSHLTSPMWDTLLIISLCHGATGSQAVDEEPR